ncbi:glutathione peroxidase [Nocardioides speluncae]|uniref:glutathione peroxidase n=1 Tax=Nocardioides speluncae TaxID=2670337 RepID=UPI001F0C5FE0|nr:glutathione peroxidase [Nocardioides speluncae]
MPKPSADRRNANRKRVGDFSAPSLTGDDVDLATYDGQVLLVVNTASRCAFTPQYDGLQSLHDRFAAQGFSVLGFPCDQFLHQEPGDEQQIGEFCRGQYGVTFPMFAKVDVNGPNAHPLWLWLRTFRDGFFGNKVKWNFTKFLVGRDGEVIRRYSPFTKPERIAGDIEAALTVAER